MAVGLAPAAAWQEDDESAVPADLARLLPAGEVPDLIESVRERNILGRLWELPGNRQRQIRRIRARWRGHMDLSGIPEALAAGDLMTAGR